MAFLEWSDELDVNVGSMNDAHRKLIDMMNHLRDLDEGDASFDEVDKSLMELAGYATQHFEEEEAYMESIGFAGLAAHKRIHAKLLAEVGEYIADFKESKEMKDDFYHFLRLWLMGHIKGVDKKYGEASE